MSNATRSFEKVFYGLRPAKQIERRMLMDGLVRLISAGFPIREAQYLGMGSIDFVDFTLFHKYLGLQRMHSVEYERSIAKRIDFNKPFRSIAHSIEPVGNYIARCDRDRPHIAWLDYDDRILGGMLDDITLAASRFAIGSVLLATVDVEAFSPGAQGMKGLRDRYVGECGDFLPADAKLSSFTRAEITRTTARVIESAVLRGLVGRPAVTFEPLFCFEYADGHLMMTVGGIFVGEREQQTLAAADLTPSYFRRDLEEEPYRIRVPKLTRRERAYLDQRMISRKNWVPNAFEITLEEVAQYREIYRYFPEYGELIV